jgi:hypothetical protein
MSLVKGKCKGAVKTSCKNCYYRREGQCGANDLYCGVGDFERGDKAASACINYAQYDWLTKIKPLTKSQERRFLTVLKGRRDKLI